jgi:hypothetical protein
MEVRKVKNKFTSLSTLTTGLQAVATILSAVRVITVSLRSIATTSPNENSQEDKEQNHKGSGHGLHKWIIVAGAVVGLITIAYLENMISNFKQKKQNVPKEQPAEERFESVYVNS